MAEVDFSNAVLSIVTANPFESGYMSMMGLNGLTNASGNLVSNDLDNRVTILDKDTLVVTFTGTFNQSGTEFYINLSVTSSNHWKISNISFSAGDTYIFKIEANIY